MTGRAWGFFWGLIVASEVAHRFRRSIVDQYLRQRPDYQPNKEQS